MQGPVHITPECPYLRRQRTPSLACIRPVQEMKVYVTRRKQETLRVAYSQGIIGNIYIYFKISSFYSCFQNEPGHTEIFSSVLVNLPIPFNCFLYFKNQFW
jgi:hypothetical protein